MRTWDFFYPDVLPEVLGCPEPTVDRHILRAAERLCAEARIWRADLDPIVTVDTVNTYDIDTPDSDTAVDRIVAATLGGIDVTLEGADGSTAQERQQAIRGPWRVTCPDTGTVTILPMPAAGQTLLLTAILKPSPTASGFSSNALADQYRIAIATGALSTLLLVKGPWRDVALAGAKALEFGAAINSARSRANKANTTARRRIQGQFY